MSRRHAPRLLAFLAGRVPRADLEDAHHEVWLRVWHHLPGHFDGSHFRGWLFRIARNHGTDPARRRADQLDRQRQAVEAGQPVTEVRAEADASVNQIIEVLRTRAESV